MSTPECSAATIVGKGRHRCAVGNVEPVAADAHAVRGDQLRGFGQPGFVHIRERQMTAAPRQRDRDGAADAARRAGDDRGPILQTSLAAAMPPIPLDQAARRLSGSDAPEFHRAVIDGAEPHQAARSRA